MIRILVSTLIYVLLYPGLATQYFLGKVLANHNMLSQVLVSVSFAVALLDDRSLSGLPAVIVSSLLVFYGLTMGSSREVFLWAIYSVFLNALLSYSVYLSPYGWISAITAIAILFITDTPFTDSVSRYMVFVVSWLYSLIILLISGLPILLVHTASLLTGLAALMFAPRIQCLIYGGIVGLDKLFDRYVSVSAPLTFLYVAAMYLAGWLS